MRFGIFDFEFYLVMVFCQSHLVSFIELVHSSSKKTNCLFSAFIGSDGQGLLKASVIVNISHQVSLLIRGFLELVPLSMINGSFLASVWRFVGSEEHKLSFLCFWNLFNWHQLLNNSICLLLG